MDFECCRCRDVRECDRRTDAERIGIEAVDWSPAVMEEDWKVKKKHDWLVGEREWPAIDLIEGTGLFPGNQENSSDGINRIEVKDEEEQDWKSR